MNSQVAVDKVLWVKRGKGVAAQGKIPQEAEFFKDHFPGFPVLPGVLALDMLRQSAECYHRSIHENGPSKQRIKQLKAVKFSDYLRPGDEWESELALVAENSGESRWNAKLMSKGKVAVSARLTVEPVPAAKTAVAF